VKATQKPHDARQSLWLDNITRDLLTSGAQALHRRIVDHRLISNPTIFDHATKNRASYDEAIRKRLKAGKSGEGLFFEIALEKPAGPLALAKTWEPPR
jgi:transaldolase